jgi:hypothetical protein
MKPRGMPLVTELMDRLIRDDRVKQPEVLWPIRVLEAALQKCHLRCPRAKSSPRQVVHGSGEIHERQTECREGIEQNGRQRTGARAKLENSGVGVAERQEFMAERFEHLRPTRAVLGGPLLLGDFIGTLPVDGTGNILFGHLCNI